MKILYAKNPKWANRKQTLINLTVRFDTINEDLPFTANLDDSEPHGKEIFQRASSGEFGEVMPFFVEPPTQESVVLSVKEERDARLLKTDWTQLPDIPQTTRDLWEPYRQALRNMPQQSGFPWYDQVVVETDLGFTVDVSKAPFPSKPV